MGVEIYKEKYLNKVTNKFDERIMIDVKLRLFTSIKKEPGCTLIGDILELESELHGKIHDLVAQNISDIIEKNIPIKVGNPHADKI